MLAQVFRWCETNSTRKHQPNEKDKQMAIKTITLDDREITAIINVMKAQGKDYLEPITEKLENYLCDHKPIHLINRTICADCRKTIN
jgi:hypothetical protein